MVVTGTALCLILHLLLAVEASSLQGQDITGDQRRTPFLGWGVAFCLPVTSVWFPCFMMFHALCPVR